MATEMLFTSTEFLIPFAFVFAVVFGALSITNVFKSKPVNVIISVAIAIFASTYSPFVYTLNQILPTLIWIFIGVFLILFIMKAFRAIGGSSQRSPFGDIATYAVILLILFSVGFVAIQDMDVNVPFIGDMENIILIMGLALIILIFVAAFNIEPHMAAAIKKIESTKKEG